MVGADDDDIEILWMTTNGVFGAFAKLFLDGANIADLNEVATLDLAFQLEGLLVPAPASLVLLLVGGAVVYGVARARGQRMRSR